MQQLHIFLADLDDPAHARAVCELTQIYAIDPMGNGKPLDDDVMERLIPGLRRHPTTRIFLVFDGEHAVGIATCFLGFSTFAARPLINIHDLAIVPDYRGHGLAKKLLRVIESYARQVDCCKITLEVVENNRRARAVYEQFGFAQAVYGESDSGALYYAKDLS
ncbi:MAG: GNAT family N-acetyltransferase [Pirellulaceae bacterium]|nr:GNAT family N-acetyltransferase [Planctomycetales bacterium]